MGGKNERSTDTHKNLNEPQKIMLSERSQAQKTTYFVSLYMTFLEKAHLQRQKARNGRKGLIQTDKRDISEAMEMF